MDPITAAIVAALAAGALTGLTETGKTAIVDAYNKLKDLLSKKYGATSPVVQSVNNLEVKPESPHRKGTLQEEVEAVNAAQDSEVLAAAKHVLTLVNAQQTGTGKFTIQNNGPIGGQNIGDNNTNTQYIGFPPPPGKG